MPTRTRPVTKHQFCGTCAHGDHRLCHTTEQHPCDCAAALHRPGMRLCAAMARYLRPDLSPDDAGALARSIFEDAS